MSFSSLRAGRRKASLGGVVVLEVMAGPSVCEQSEWLWDLENVLRASGISSYKSGQLEPHETTINVYMRWVGTLLSGHLLPLTEGSLEISAG